MSVVGIDLGYQNSVVAAAGRGGVDVILNGNSNRLNPSLVGFDECRKLGEVATAGIMSNYKNTIKGMKRLVGLTFDDPRAIREMKWTPGVHYVPIRHESGGPDTIAVQVNVSGEVHTIPIEAVCGMLIKHLGEIAARKAAAESNAGMDTSNDLPRDWVIAIPNYYNDAQRRSILAGCQMAGVSNVQRLMHESTATALAYGIYKDLRKEFSDEQPRNVMFIDVGASSYSVSIVSFVPGKLIVKSSYCDPDLGGRNFDETVANWIADKFEEKYKGKLSGKPMEQPKTRLKLMMAAENAKKTLSPVGVKEARINLEMLMDDLDFSASLMADEYETLCQPLLDRLAGPISAAMAEAKLQAEQLSAVEIVGGTTRIGCLKRKLVELLGGNIQLSTTMNADEAVARGAALQSAILSPRFKVLPYVIEELQPYPVRLNWAKNVDNASSASDSNKMEVDVQEAKDSVIIFDRGTSFPVVRRVTIKRADKFVVRCQYDESATKYGIPESANQGIADFVIHAEPGEEKKIRVDVKQDIHGTIHLSSVQMLDPIEDEAPPEATPEDDNEKASEERKKKIKKVDLSFSIQRPLQWNANEINKFYESEVAMTNTDRLVKETGQMRNELESYIYDMRDKVVSDSFLKPYGSEEEKNAFVLANDAMETWLYEEGFDATKSTYAEKLQELKALGGPLEKRCSEAQNRPAAISLLQGTLEEYTNWMNGTGQSAEHITDEEREKFSASTESTSSWFRDMMDKQNSLKQFEDPVLTVSELKSKLQELTNVCGPIMNKPIPIKVVDENKDPMGNQDSMDEAVNPTSADAKTTENSTGENMDGVEIEKNKIDDNNSMDVE